MKLTKHYCDKCKKELEPGIVKNVKIGLMIEYLGDPCIGTEGYKTYKVHAYDICQECAEWLITQITGCEPTPVI